MTNSLEEVLKSSSEMEAKLIGYDETPIDVVLLDASGFDNLNVQESRRNFNSQGHPINQVRNGHSSGRKPVRQSPTSSGAVKMRPNKIRENPKNDANSQSGGTVNVSCTYRVSSMGYFSNLLTQKIFQVHTRQHQDLVCMKSVPLTTGNLLYSSAAMKKDQAT